MKYVFADWSDDRFTTYLRISELYSVHDVLDRPDTRKSHRALRTGFANLDLQRFGFSNQLK